MANIIETPKLSDTMSTGTLVKWLKKEGDKISSGDMLAEVETDKATMELESFFDGTLVKIFAQAGTCVAIGAPLCAIGEPGEKVEAPIGNAAPKAAEPAPHAAKPKQASLVPMAAPTSASFVPTIDERLKISPLAKKIAAQQQINVSCITGSGPGGRIVKADVLAAAADSTKIKQPAPVAPLAGGTLSRTTPIQEGRTMPASNMRATIAKRLLESKVNTPHFYLEIEVDAEPLLALRAQLNASLKAQEVKPSLNDFILKASAEALRRIPGVNSSWVGTGIQYHAAVHVSFAVAIEDGLITPVVKDAHTKSVFQISTEAKSLGKRANEKKLKPEEFTGGTFCVSNLGMMGIKRFSAIINPPNSAIVAVGAAVAKPVVKNSQIVVGQTMVLTLSCDHRVVNGALGAQFLGELKDLVEKPATLLI